MREGGREGREEGGREEEREGGGREEGGREGWREGREGGREGGRTTLIMCCASYGSSSERSSVMYVQDTQEGVLADSMSHQSNKSITKTLQHIKTLNKHFDYIHTIPQHAWQ